MRAVDISIRDRQPKSNADITSGIPNTSVKPNEHHRVSPGVKSGGFGIGARLPVPKK